MNPPQQGITSKFHLLKSASPLARPLPASSGVCPGSGGSAFSVGATTVFCRGSKEILVVSSFFSVVP
jgi:hypothetical protein